MPLVSYNLRKVTEGSKRLVMYRVKYSIGNNSRMTFITKKVFMPLTMVVYQYFVTLAIIRNFTSNLVFA